MVADPASADLVVGIEPLVRGPAAKLKNEPNFNVFWLRFISGGVFRSAAWRMRGRSRT
jgi:hypothetical protein